VTRNPVAPPAWAHWLAEQALQVCDREFLLADLDDEYAARRASGRRALAWYLAQTGHAAWTRRRHRAWASRPLQPRSALTSIASDFRASVRGFRGQPSAIATVVLSLGLGIGSASAMFSVVRAVLIAPLPYGHADRLVTIWSRWTGFEKTWLSGQEVLDYRARSRSLAAIAAWTSGRVTLTGVGDAVRVNAGIVTANTFDVCGVAPLYGRTFTEEEATASSRSGQPLFAVLSYGLWRDLLGTDPAIVGRVLTINDRRVAVLGVMPPGFQLPTDFGPDAPEPTTLWLPGYIDPAKTSRGGGHSLYAAARLAEGASAALASVELASISRELVRAGEYPPSMHFSAFAVPVDDDLLGGVRPSMRVLVGAVAFLLLIACANAAALLVARAESRRREWITRAALGASRWRLLRQQLVEGLALSLVGGGLGIGVAVLATRGLSAMGPSAIPRASGIAVDWHVVGFMLAVSIGAALVCSLAPALYACRLDLVAGLKDGTANASAGRGRQRLRGALVTSQIALGMLLLAGAGLMARTLWSLHRIDLGFTPAGVLTARVDLPATRYDTLDKIDAYFDAVLSRVRARPDVTAAGLIRWLPLATTLGDWGLHIEGRAAPPGDSPTGDLQLASPGALEALGERLIRGRLFTDRDRGTAMPVALVNATMARLYWPTEDPIGRRVRLVDDSRPWVTIVGIIGDVRHTSVSAPVKTKIYLPYSQFPLSTGFLPVGSGTIVVRTSGNPLSSADAVRRAAREVGPQVPVAAVRPMTEIMETTLTAPRLTSHVLGGFAVIAIVLSAVGLYGLLVHMVTQRTQEIGIRMAIGARPRQVVQRVFAQGVRIAVVGTGAGLGLAALMTRALAGLLYGVTPWDPLTFVVAPLALVVVAMLASLVPALRAASIDPLKALRHL
jgi:putative ABC transport system permease protein